MQRRFFPVWLTSLVLVLTWLMTTALVTIPTDPGGQVPFGTATSPDIPVSHRDRVYTADQWSNTVTVTDPVSQPAPGRHPSRRTHPRQFEPAVWWASADPRHGLLARSPHPRWSSPSLRILWPSSTRQPIR